jgi:hypothetical protein
MKTLQAAVVVGISALAATAWAGDRDPLGQVPLSLELARAGAGTDTIALKDVTGGGMISPRDAATGQATGRRIQQPLVVQTALAGLRFESTIGNGAAAQSLTNAMLTVLVPVDRVTGQRTGAHSGVDVLLTRAMIANDEWRHWVSTNVNHPTVVVRALEGRGAVARTFSLTECSSSGYEFGYDQGAGLEQLNLHCRSMQIASTSAPLTTLAHDLMSGASSSRKTATLRFGTGAAARAYAYTNVSLASYVFDKGTESFTLVGQTP